MPGANTSADRLRARTVAFVGAKPHERLAVLLRDGRLVAVPLDLYPTLKNATPAQRRRWRLIGDGQGVHWPGLDLDLSTEGIVSARPDRTLRGGSRASDRAAARMRLGALADTDRPMTATEIASLLERALPPARLRDVVAKLDRQSRPRAPRRGHKASA